MKLLNKDVKLTYAKVFNEYIKRLIIFLVAIFYCLFMQNVNAQDKILFSSDFENGLNKVFKQQKAADNRIQIVLDSTLKKKVLRFEVAPKDLVINRNRAEININDDSIIGYDNLIYFWKFKIPTDNLEGFAKGKWRIIGQWHGRPTENQSIQELNKKSLAPPVSIELLQQQGKWVIGIRYGLVEKNESGLIEKSRRIIAKGVIKPNEWNDIKVHIHWSQQEDGFIEASLNDSIITPFNGENYLFYGRNLYNDKINAFKLGIYRSWNFKTNDVVYYTDIKISKTTETVILK